MGITININGLTLCHKDSGGVVRNTLPDVCKTPAAKNKPLPYPKIVFSKDLAKGTNTVKADGGHMCAIRGSEFSTAIGDEPGLGGGANSGTHLHRETWLSWSPDMFMEDKPARRLSDMMLMNNGNTVSRGGLNQPPLTLEQIDELLCAAACECKAALLFQRCVANKIREHVFGGDYPCPGSRIWSEVSIQVRDGAWEIIRNSAGTGPISHPITPGGGIRADTVAVHSAGQPTRMIEMKFPVDSFNANPNPMDPNNACNRAAEDLGVENDCPCWGGGLGIVAAAN